MLVLLYLFFVLKMRKLSVVSLTTKKNTLDLLSPETNQKPAAAWSVVPPPCNMYSPKKPNRQKWQQQEQQKTGYTAIYHKKLGRPTTQWAISLYDIGASAKIKMMKGVDKQCQNEY